MMVLDTKPQLICACQPSLQTSQKVICSTTDFLCQNIVISVVFFYKGYLDTAVLINSLEIILNDFFIFAGRFRESDRALTLECNNKGVRFSQQTETGSMEQLLRVLPNVQKKRLVDVLTPKQIIAGKEPPLTVKLTQFKEGGTALGLCCHHALGDMHTLMYFMKAWSAAAECTQYNYPLVIEDRADYLQSQLPKNVKNRPNIRHLKSKSLLQLSSYLLFQSHTKSDAAFYFSEDELNRMKQSLFQKVNQNLSSNDVLCAHVYNWIARADRRYSSSRNFMRRIGIAINYRQKTQVSQSALGNFFEVVPIDISQNTPSHRLAQIIRETVNSFETQHVSYFSNLKYIEKNGGIQKNKYYLGEGADPTNKTLLMTNWSKFGVYDVVFSGHQPFFFTPFADVLFPWVSMIVGGCANKGLVYSTVLPSELMKTLTQADSLRSLHQYREPGDTLPSFLTQLPWLL